MNELFEIADEVSVFRDGRFVGEHPAADVTRDDIIKPDGRARNDADVPEAGSPDRRRHAVGEEPHARRPLSRHVSFDLRKGEILGFAGLVGSGRCNVAETLFGVTPATSGQIFIDGREIAGRASPAWRWTPAWRFLTEDRKESGCFLLLDVMANMQAAILRNGYTRGGFVREREIEQLCQEQKTKLRVRTPDLEEPVINLSGGNQQKVLIARWLMTKPRILILDEPTRGIDVGAKAEIHRLIIRTRRPGRRRADDLLRTAGGARHERPRAGDARGSHDRHRRSQGCDPGQNHGTRRTADRRGEE